MILIPSPRGSIRTIVPCVFGVISLSRRSNWPRFSRTLRTVVRTVWRGDCIAALVRRADGACCGDLDISGRKIGVRLRSFVGKVVVLVAVGGIEDFVGEFVVPRMVGKIRGRGHARHGQQTSDARKQSTCTFSAVFPHLNFLWTSFSPFLIS